MGLLDYRKKRKLQNSPEPAGRKITAGKGNLRFVVQEHHATHLHYDFRLEFKGLLLSWAVPKGPPLLSSEKRLAIQVEDHPLDYIDFQGTIPKGNYGAGTVKIWDKGSYEAENANSRNESENLIQKGLEEGHLSFVLNGEKLRGAYSLVRFRGKESKEWLFIKKNKNS